MQPINSKNETKTKNFGSRLGGLPGSQIGGSRFASRMKSSMLRNFGSGKTRYARQGSSQYSVVRENGDPVIHRSGRDVTPLNLQMDENTDTSNYNVQRYQTNSIKEKFQCFIEPDEPLEHIQNGMGNADGYENETAQNGLNFRPSENMAKMTDTDDQKMGKSANQNVRAAMKVMMLKPNDKPIDQIANQTLFEHFLQQDATQLQKMQHAIVSETDTQLIFQLPSLPIYNSEESKREREKISDINDKYQQLIKQHENSDLFSNAQTQTLVVQKQNRLIQAVPVETLEQGTQASKWQIQDAMTNSPETIAQSGHGDVSNLPPLSIDSFDSESINNALSNMECVIVQNFMSNQQKLYRTHAKSFTRNRDEFDSDDDQSEVMSQSEIKEHLERRNSDEIGNELNQHNHEIAETENGNGETVNSHDDVASKPNKMPHLQLLWNFQCYNTKETASCTCIDINHQNEDIIASGYGHSNFGNNHQGTIKFWTLKNPTNPIRTYKTASSVCSINFSKVHASLLAVGLFDGNVAVYDIRTKSTNPILKSDLLGDSASQDNAAAGQSGLEIAGGGSGHAGRSKSSQSKHNRAVWNVMWEQGNKIKDINNNDNNNNNNNNNNNSDKNESESNYNSVNNHYGRHTLFSISSDGDIKQWSMKKGFQSTAVMSLKRVPNLAAPRGSGIDSNTNTIRSRQASGLCFDFPNENGNIQYFVGTEDGIVHKCSVSYNEQVLRTYYGHTGPVYAIQCNPFDADKFLTCSNDWTIKIWDQSITTPLIDLHSSNTPVNDIQWSHFNSCVFASANTDGKLELWDLETSKKDPIISHQVLSNKAHVECIKFVKDTPSILAGLDNGQIAVYRINNIKTTANTSNLQQIAKLYRSLQASD